MWTSSPSSWRKVPEGAATFNIDRNLIVIATKTRTLRAASLLVTSRENGAASFVLTVPDKITRRYYGTLELKPGSGKLTAVVNMDLETAVASVVGAESTPNDPIEALKAQSVATRSYYVAGKRRHHGFDFCDTTHCQLLREPSPPSSQVAQAVSATRGMVLAYQSHPFAAMYTRSCSGHTKTPKDVGMPGDSYPYYSVDCKYCQEHPFRWQRRIAASDAAKLHSSNEASRLNLVRRLGWNTVPGDDFKAVIPWKEIRRQVRVADLHVHLLRRPVAVEAGQVQPGGLSGQQGFGNGRMPGAQRGNFTAVTVVLALSQGHEPQQSVRDASAG